MSRVGWSRRSGTVLLAAVLWEAACGGGSGDGPAIATTPLAGTVGGQPWALVGGETDAFLSSGESDFFTTLYMEPVDPCTSAGFSVTSNQLIVEVPMAAGDYSRGVTFVVDPGGSNQNLITFGHVVVEEVTATTVSGGLYARYNDSNVVNGQFQATICAQ